MGEVLFELEQALRSRPEKLTSGEANVLLTCKSKALREFTFGALAGSSVSWLATWKLNKFFRLNLSGGAAIVFGLWRFGRSLESCVDNILSLDGSRLQREVASIIANRYQDDPWRMRLLYKHFYSEKVYDDSTSDQPKLRWRHKNYFSDNVAHGQRTQESNSYGDSQSDSSDNSQNKSQSTDHSNHHNDPGSKKINLSKQVPVHADVDPIADPLDCIFGNMGAPEEIHHRGASRTPTRGSTRTHKRSLRRRRLHHHEVEPQQT